MPGVQARCRAVHGQPKAHDAAGTERDPRQASRIDRAVAEEPEIRAQQVSIRGERPRQVRRTRLLLALEEELQIDGAWNLRRNEGIDRGQHRDDGPLVVAGGAGVDARLIGKRVLHIGPRDCCGAIFHLSGAQDRLEGRCLPCRLGPDRLAVEVRIEKECPPRALRAELAVHGDRCAGGFEDAGSDAALFQHPDQKLGIAADVGLARCDVRQCEELPQLADDGFLVGGDVSLGGGNCPRLVGRRRHCGVRERYQDSDETGAQKRPLRRETERDDSRCRNDRITPATCVAKPAFVTDLLPACD